MTMQLTKLFPKSELALLVRSYGAKFDNFWQEKTVRIATRISFAILLFILAFLLFTWQKLPPQVPLFYSLPWGEEQLASPNFLLILPFSCLCLGILNFFLAVFCLEQHSLAAKILVWVTTSLIFLASFTLVKIVFLIT